MVVRELAAQSTLLLHRPQQLAWAACRINLKRNQSILPDPSATQRLWHDMPLTFHFIPYPIFNRLVLTGCYWD
jgi:hypothetical protein